MIEKLKSLGWTALGLLFFVLLLVTIGVLIGGAGWLSEHLLPWFAKASVLTFFVLVLLLLPLSIPKATRGFAAGAILLASYIFGATVWMQGLVTTLDLWGGFAVAIGLFFMGVGVVPIGMLAALFHGQWSLLFLMLALVILTFGTRFFSIWLSDERQPQLIQAEEERYLVADSLEEEI